MSGTEERGFRRMRTAACRGCGATIGFIKTEKGKTMPVNPEAVYFIPSGGPDTFVMANGSLQRGRAAGWSERDSAWIGYRSHFATCPEADRFRKRRKG